MTENETLYSGRYLALRRTGSWEFVDHLAGAQIVSALAITPAREVVLVEQWRPPIASTSVELPSGLQEGAETPEEAARRELLEETGYATSGSPIKLGTTALSAGLSSSRLVLVGFDNVERVADGGGTDDEAIRVLTVPMDRVAFLSSVVPRAVIDWRVLAAIALWTAIGTD